MFFLLLKSSKNMMYTFTIVFHIENVYIIFLLPVSFVDYYHHGVYPFSVSVSARSEHSSAVLAHSMKMYGSLFPMRSVK